MHRLMADPFETIVGRLDYPMLVVTTTGSDGELAGCLVGFATQARGYPSSRAKRVEPGHEA